ncbi:MAG: enoyl-CoA hydratase/isomerase family protein [Propionibacteriaceae bacterium]|jgi:enoyl-CoA hydratase|nr:enoyl-CoA hydratase/isomerase family protein [Propionibacteriaceae bacterium]
MAVNLVIDAYVATVTIDRPEALNALNSGVLKELDDALDQIQASDARVLVLTGAGRSFVAGADIGEMVSMTPAEAEEFSKLGNAVFRKLEQLPIPSIAAVNGFALGGGCELALSCDIRLASEKAVFGQPEVGIGVTPGFGGTQRLARLCGVAVASELIFSTGRIKADRALAVGLVNAVYPVEELMGEAAKLAAQIAAQAPLAVRACKVGIRDGLAGGLDEGLALEAKVFASCFGTADQKEGMGAFLEKRPANPFQGA